jgi:Tfp pilus assembly protein PilF
MKKLINTFVTAGILLIVLLSSCTLNNNKLIATTDFEQKSEKVFMGSRDVDYYRRMAHKYVSDGEYSVAVVNLKRAIDMNPSDDVLYNELASLYLSLGKKKLARRYLLRTLKLNPRNVQARALIDQHKL